MSSNNPLWAIKPEIEEIEKCMAEEIGHAGNDLLAEVLRYGLLGSGKRVRPLLTLISARMCGGEAAGSPAPHSGGGNDIYRLAMVFEFLHAASLLHDDVIDHADTRRGREAANRVWSNAHVILAGDYLHTRAMLLAGTIGGKRCLEIISNATAAMVESEFLQLQNAERMEIAEEGYFQVLKGKTAALIAAACEAGAVFAGADEKKRAALSLYGANIGLTFQIADDLLDYLGDPARTGKAVGNDFQEGKMTLPLIHVLEKGEKADREALQKLLASPGEERARQIDTATSLIERNNGFAYAREKGAAMTAEAVAALDIFADSPEKETLTALAHYILNRNR